MFGKRVRGAIAVVALSWTVGACTEATPEVKEQEAAAQQAAALSEPHQVVAADADAVPTFVTGSFGAVPSGLTAVESIQPEQLLPVLDRVAPLFRLDPGSLYLKKAYVGFDGDAHFRYGMRQDGIEVLGAEVRLHARDGVVFAANTNARGDLAVAPPTAAIRPEEALETARVDRASPPGATVGGEPRLVYWRDEGQLVLAYEVRVQGTLADGSPVDDSVLVNARTGEAFERLSHVHSALSRVVYSGNPPRPVRTEGQPPVGNALIDSVYDNLGGLYHCYNGLFGRDSVNGLGGQLIADVNEEQFVQTLLWDGVRLVVRATGTGGPTPPLDLISHEVTHAVTDTESGLIYSGESGGLNESMSDIFGAVCEWHSKGRVVDADTWRIGEGGWIPEALVRSLSNPTSDGASLDWYPDYVSGTDVHYSSGISNLAFYLLAQGGMHPRAKSPTVVQGIGMERAARILYKMNVDLLLPSSNFLTAKTAAEQAAAQLGYDAATIGSVSDAWKAVGVVPFIPNFPRDLAKDVPITGLSGARGARSYFSVQVPEGAYDLTFTLSGGTGDADLYVRHAFAPTTTSYDCRPFKTGNDEVCTFPSPAEGTWYVMLNAFSAYSGVSLVVTWKGGYARLEPGVAVTGLSGAPGSSRGFTLQVPESLDVGTRSLHVRLSGGSGNADLYVRRALFPDHSTYDCRSLQDDNTEACDLSGVEPGRYYIQVYGSRGGFEGASLLVTLD